MTTLQKENYGHIYVIICHNTTERAAELICKNGYAKSETKAMALIDEINGK